MDTIELSALRNELGTQMEENVLLSGFTSARIGGPADVFITIRSAEELAQTAKKIWDMGMTFQLIGGGSNILVSDKGIRGITLLNRARKVRFEVKSDEPSVFAESGATLNDIAQQAARNGLCGLEWAASVPGTLGGAVYGNAGAFGGEMSTIVQSIDVIDHEQGKQNWLVEKMEYSYRSSILKRTKRETIILSATLKLEHGNGEAIKSKMASNSERRRNTQPPGASMGSIFKNPSGDKAGRLLEAAGLKGTRIGNAEISSKHANFFINTDKTSASDMKALVELAQETVMKKFGIKLEPEIEIIGEW
jgi:UDP-N-acetylmuramate dehydrogenase